jgi:hypothetical protein
MSLENGDNSSTTAATTVADAGFHLEQTLTQVWGQLIVHLSSASLLPLHPHDTITAISHFLDECGNLTYTTAVIQSLQSISARIETHTANLRHQLVVKKHVSRKLLKQVARANERAMAFERAFLQQKQYGWYRHVVYAPDVHTGVSRMFPALVDAVQSGNMSFVEEADLYIANMLMEAGKALWDDDDDDDDDSFVDEDDEEENN